MFYLTSASDVAMGVIKLNRIKANEKYVPHTHSDPLQFSKYRPTGFREIKILVGTFAHVKNRQPPSSYWTIQTLPTSSDVLCIWVKQPWRQTCVCLLEPTHNAQIVHYDEYQFT